MNATDRNLYRLKAQVLKAMAHPLRLAVLEYLRDGEQCVCDIAAFVGSERSNISRHLSVMLNAGIVDCRKEGLKVIYSLRTPCVLGFLSCVTDALRQQLQDNARVLQKL